MAPRETATATIMNIIVRFLLLEKTDPAALRWSPKAISGYSHGPIKSSCQFVIDMISPFSMSRYITIGFIRIKYQSMMYATSK
jgi:hypothetical protein